jgi:uncharacterized protein YdhG (YjbR/CyaY superfamily)
LPAAWNTASAKATSASTPSSPRSRSEIPTSTTVDAYAAALPDQSRDVLDKIRELIAKRVPGVHESIRYQMPVFTFDGIYLVYVGAWKHHIGLYPIPALAPDLEADVARYRTKTDTVRFLYKQPIPYELIERLIDALLTIRIKENK